MAEPLLDRLMPGMLLLADRGFFSYALWRKAIGTGADLLWRVRTDTGRPRNRPACRTCPTVPGWRTCGRRIQPQRHGRSRCWSGSSTTPSTTVEKTPPATGCSPPCSTPPRSPRPSLAAAYTQRWEIELAFDELKTHQRGPRTVLRTKSPDLVAPGDLGTPVLPLRDPLADDRGRPPRRTRPRPGQLRRRPADHPPVHRPPGRLSPLTHPEAATAAG